MKVRSAGGAKAAASPPPADRAAHHNRVLQAGVKRAEALEGRLARVLEPILAQAGVEAAANFEANARDWLTAAVGDPDVHFDDDTVALADALAALTNPWVNPQFAVATPGVTSLSTMVALIPHQDEAAALEHQEIPAHELHVTLCYLGEVEGDLAPVVAAVAQAAASHAPMAGSVAGMAAFADNGNGNPSIVLPSVPGLVELRVAVTQALAAQGIAYSRSYGYVPHMTVGYGEPDSDYFTFPSVDCIGQPLSFDAVWVVRGDVERHRVALTGATPVTASGGFAWERLSDDEVVRREIRRVAAEHHASAAPDYGETYWDPAAREVLWISADWTTNDEIDAAVAAFLEIDGVDQVEVCAECGADDRYEKVYAGLRQTFGAPGEPGIADESPTAKHPGGELPIPADDPAAMGPTGQGYRTASSEATSCATCSYYGPGTYYRCGRFDVFVDPGMVCNAYDEALVEPIAGQDDWTDGDNMIGRRLKESSSGQRRDLHATSDRSGSGSRPATSNGDPSRTANLALAADAGWSKPTPDELIDVDKLVKSLRGKTDPVRALVVESVMAASLANVGLEWDATNPFTAKVLAQSGSQIKDIAQTTQLNVMRIIKGAYEEGLTIPDTAKAIRVGMKDASSARATLIARTELAGAVNGGSVAATQIVSEATGVEFTKTWHTSEGAQYPRHEDYDGLDDQTVGLDEYFDVGGFALNFPGDPDGPAEEICNCRCTVLYTEVGGDQVEEDAA